MRIDDRPARGTPEATVGASPPAGHPLVTFTLGEQRYALPLSVVLRVEQAVDVTRLPRAPRVVLGVINVHGTVIPVLDPRARFGQPQREIQPEDHLLLAHTSRRQVALFVDRVIGVETPERRLVVAPESVLPAMEFVKGVALLPDGLVLIHDLDAFLSLEEESQLAEALSVGD